MKKFICPYCGEDHIEEEMKRHFIFVHEMDASNAPESFDDYEKRYGILGLARYIGEDDESE